MPADRPGAGFRPPLPERAHLTFLTLAQADLQEARDSTTGDAPARVESLTPLEVPDVVGERYERVTLLGRGGMGSVWRMRDRVLGRPVAMKVVRAGLVRPSALERFDEEVRIAAQLQHPAIIPIHDYGRLADGRPWFVMQVVRGRTLEEAMVGVHRALRLGRDASDDGFSLRRLLELFLRACEAVAYAHVRGVVHRDLKPANIMLGDFGEVFVVDWGLAKVLARESSPDDTLDEPIAPLGRRMTQAGAITGTPSYMAPEQAQGRSEEAGPPADVHALGASLYDLLCDRPPRTARTVEILVYRVGTGTPIEPPSVHAATFPVDAELDRICLKALAHAEADRYPDAGAFAADLAAWLDGARKRDRAMELVEEAEEAIRAAAESEARGRRKAEAAATAARAVGRMAPESEKRPVWALEDEVEAERREAADARTRAVQLLRTALSHAPGLPEADDRLADLFRDQHARLEAAGRDQDARAVAAEIARHDTARRHATYLRGTGSVTLVTDPPGATVTRLRVEERHRRLVAVDDGPLGVTPLVDAPLEMGRWVLRIEHPDREVLLYPVRIARTARWDGVPPGADAPAPIAMPPRGSLGAGEVCVPAGWFQAGTARFEHAHPSPPRQVWLDGFAIDRFPVTIRRYVAFLDALVAAGREDEALRHQPRVAENDEPFFARGDDGRFLGIRTDRAGTAWDHLPRSLDAPVTLIDWHDAAAFCAWRADAEGLPWRLPLDLEWQKAARGVDGREYPWGDHFEPTWCRSSGASVPAMWCEVDSYPTDASPYGVRGLAGNVQDWLLGLGGPEPRPGLIPHEPGRRWSAGGYAGGGPSAAAATSRVSSADYHRSLMRGFRCVRTIG
jgi:formylglycine-generating enzyme required for sulfatase activity